MAQTNQDLYKPHARYSQVSESAAEEYSAALLTAQHETLPRKNTQRYYIDLAADLSFSDDDYNQRVRAWAMRHAQNLASDNPKPTWQV